LMLVVKALVLVAVLAVVQHSSAFPVVHEVSTTFSTSFTNKDSLTFVSIGDWGSVCDQQARVAKAMGEWAEKNEADFVISTGDNFYPLGVHSSTDGQFHSTFDSVYTAESLQKRWYVVAGNHDHYGFAKMEIDFMKLSPRWYYPALHYTETMTFGSNTTVQFVFLDTINLELIRFVSRAEELQWFTETLANSTADWLIVIGHFPVFSGGEHGSTSELQQDVMPLMQKYKVAAYINGHDHTMQHLSSGGIDYFVSGGGAKLGRCKNLPETKFGKAVGGFMLHQLAADKMTTTIVDDNGNALYETVTPRVNRRE